MMRFDNYFIAVVVLLFLTYTANAQNTPIGGTCNGADCYETFAWSSVQDGSGTTLPFISEGVAMNASCNTIIGAEAEVELGSGGDLNPGSTLQARPDGAGIDNWTVTFDAPLTNPTINMSALMSSSTVEIQDCAGNSITTLTGSTSYSEQLTGTFTCLYMIVTSSVRDFYTFDVGTCLSSNPIPPCTTCPDGQSYRYLTLANRSGTGTDATADVFLNGQLYGDATVLFSNLSVSEDLSGSKFGAFASGRTSEETFILQVDLCAPISIQQLDILGLETESQAWVGTSLSGTGQAAVPAGISLSRCGGPANMEATGNMVTNTHPSCRNQGNGNYTAGGVSVSTLYFKYNNPVGGCNFDKATFRIGSCVADMAMAVPSCPMSLVTVTSDLGATTDTYVLDANGNYFDRNSCYTSLPTAPEVTIAVSPCAELINETPCADLCGTPTPCVTCPNDFNYHLIDFTGATGSTGDIEIDGIPYGTFEVVQSDLDVNVDVSGTLFGGFDDDGGTLLIRADLNLPVCVSELTIRGLEVESKVSVGNTASSNGQDAVLSGINMTQCEGPAAMSVTGNSLVMNMAGGCRANLNGRYSLGNAKQSTVYFKYENPDMGCSYDWVGLSVGVCLPPPVVGPIHPNFMGPDGTLLKIIQTSDGSLYVVDASGYIFDYDDFSKYTPSNPIVPVMIDPSTITDTDVCWNNPNLDTKGLCTSNGEAIPTVGEWGLIILGLMMSIIGILSMSSIKSVNRI